MKFTYLATIVAVGLLSLGACSEDQSSFNVENIPGRCLIEGIIKYNEGTTMENGHFAYTYKPASELEVTITISNSEYGSGLYGESRFTTMTDAEGKYSIEIPAPSDNANVRITTSDFRGVRKYITQENNKIVSKTENVIYRGSDNATVHSQGIVYANIVCTMHSVDNPIDGLNQLATIKGKIGQGVEYVDPAKRNYDDNNKFTGYSNANLYYVYTGAKVDMIIRVNYNNKEYTYNTTSDSNGDWSLQVPVYTFPANFNYSITCMPYNSSYTHYVEEKRQYTVDNRERTYTDYIGHTLSGYYSQTSNYSYSATFPVAEEIISNDSKIMLFEPFDNGQDIFGYTSRKYSSTGYWRSELIEILSENK